MPTDTSTTTDRRLPRAGTVWQLDPAHTTIGAVARHMMVTKVRGTFSSFRGAVHVGDSLDDTRIEVEIDADSIDTGDAKRDEHLRSPDFLDVANHPRLTFASTRIVDRDGGGYRVHGDLTIRGVTQPVTLDVTYAGLHTDPWGQQVAIASAETELVREHWGITWNQALEAGGVLVSRTLQVEIEAQAKQEERSAA